MPPIHQSAGRSPVPQGPLMSRATPAGPITTPDVPRPVLATLRWLDGYDMDVPASAIAWTRHGVEVLWENRYTGLTREWIDPSEVQRGQTAIPQIGSRRQASRNANDPEPGSTDR